MHPFLSNDFAFQWSRLTADHVEPDIALALEEAQRNIDAVAAQDASDPEKLSYESTLEALDEATETLNRAWGLVSHLDSIRNSKPLREAYNTMLPKVSEFSARIPLNEKLWAVLKAYSQSAEAEALRGDKRRFLEETLADFREAGADLPGEKKQRLEQLESALAAKTQKFSENDLDSTNAWELVIDDESLLEGLPENAKAAARQSAEKKGLGTAEAPQWRFTLHAPSYLPVMKYLKDSELRRKVWVGSTEVGHKEPYDNTALIREVLVLRQEKAQILGKEQFGDLVLARRMAKTGAEALGFVDDLHQRVKPAFDQEQADVLAFMQKATGAEGLMEPWDAGYWAEKQRQALYDFDEEALRPYFPIDRVINGLFDLVQQVFQIEIEEKPSVFIDSESKERTPSDAPEDATEVWHPDVKFYEMTDQEGRVMGSFYADWYPREDKRSGAWMNFLRTGERDPARERSPHLGLICGNMTPSLGDKPALLDHREVETVFHEFGHLMHHLCGEVSVKSLNGVNVAWDFVELPSQIMENWCWERESLDLFARHHQSGEAIPEELFQKMLRARNYMAASMTMRQLALGKMDLELHLRYAREPEKLEDIDATLGSLLEPYTARYKTTPPSIVRRFGHLFSSPTGYAAGYYSYKWAEVLDADAFTRFKQEGIMNGETGRDFREKILARGNAEAPDQLFRDFMGRDPELRALLDRSGLLEATA